MKKRRVQAEELSKMESAVVIWHNPLGNPDRGKWRASKTSLKRDLHCELHAELYGKKIFTQSLEELMLRLVAEHPCEKLLSVTSSQVGEFASPAYADLLRGDIVVNEVTA